MSRKDTLLAVSGLLGGNSGGGGGGGPTLITKTITANGTYAASDDNADGYSSVTVDVAGGGALATEEGTFTPTGVALSYITITHSLNTTKIFGMLWVEPDENNEIVAPNGYTIIFSHFITYNYPNDLYNGVTLVQNYTSSDTKTAVYPSPEAAYLRHYKSTWTNKAAAWDGAYTTRVRFVSNSSFEVSPNPNAGNFPAGVTYHYKLWALED